MTLTKLRSISKQYNANMKMMIKTVGTPEHEQYVRIEHKLNNLDMVLRKDLHIYVPDPCPLTYVGSGCEDCTGWYRREQTWKHKRCWITVRTEQGEGTQCPIKPIVSTH